MKTAEDLANEIGNRLLAIKPASPAKSASLSPDHITKLTEAGYPVRALRALRALPGITGPALDKAREKFEWVQTDGILLLIGPTGRGKTVMASWWAMERLKAGQACGRFLTAYQLFARMKQCWTKGEDADAVLKQWKTAKFLVIDELQTRTESAWENSVLDELVNARYAACLPTVLIGNIDPGKEQATLGARIVDRVRECGGIINCGWPSYRR